MTRIKGNMTIDAATQGALRWEPSAVAAYLLERPDDAWEVLRQTIGRVAGPWHRDGLLGPDATERSALADFGVAAWVGTAGRDHEGQWYWRIPGTDNDGYAPTIEAAQHASDAALTAAGWVLADAETSDQGRGDHADE